MNAQAGNSISTAPAKPCRAWVVKIRPLSVRKDWGKPSVSADL